MLRVLFVNAAAAGEEVPATDTAPAYTEYTVNVDGELQTIKLTKQPGLFAGALSYISMPFFGVFNATIENGYVTKLVVDPALIQGFSIAGVKDGKITLGVKDEEYTFAKDARVFLGSKEANIEKLEIAPSEIAPEWDAAYWLELNDAGEIQKMYIVGTSLDPRETNEPLVSNIKKFDFAVGPADENGISVRYNYFAPEIADEETKYPLVIWFPGNGCSAYDWQAMFDYNAIGNFASEEFQAEFTAGGAYVMQALANETYTGGFISNWNQNQVPAFFLALEDFIAQNPNVDTDRIYVGGFSMGGVMTWIVINERPDYFAAAFPNAPSLTLAGNEASPESLSPFTSLPIWQVHGIADPVVAGKETTQIIPFFNIEAKRTGTDTRISLWEEHFVDPDGNQIPIDHLSWAVTLNNMKMNDGSLYVDMYGNPVQSSFIEWLNGQSRSANLKRAADAEAIREAEFTDVNADNWYYVYVSMLYEAGVVNGIGNNKFEPNAPTKFGEALKMIMLTAGIEPQESEEGEHWASGYLSAAIGYGLIPDGDYKLGEAIDRLTIAQLAARALKLDTTITESPFPDTDDPSVLALYEAGIISGDNLGKFNPDSSLTRAELAKIVLIAMLKLAK